ncbi:MAG: PEP-CTERM sorting domain-containing protein [Parahaliea sp.]
MSISRTLCLAAALLCTSSIATARTIGPDGFGYTATDEIAFNWIDISTTGTDLNIGSDSWTMAPLGFDFSFYGQTNHQVNVNANGVLSIVDGFDGWVGYMNTPLPGVNHYQSNYFMAVYWENLWPLRPGIPGDTIYYETQGSPGERYFITQWNNVTSAWQWGYPSNTMTFQAILFEGTNDILFQYLYLDPTEGNGATVGLQEETIGLEWSYNQALSEQLAICFSYNGTNCGITTDPGNPGTSVASPATLALMGLGLVGLAGFRRRSY